MRGESVTGKRNPPSSSTALHTFLIADVRGYTSFTLERGDEAAARLATRFADIVSEQVTAREGNLIELRGDEALAVFPSARQALRAACDLQERFAAERAAEPNLPIDVGIGLEAGEAVPVNGGYRGAALNLAARLCALARPGEVLTTITITSLARHVEGVEYVERGLTALKGFADPVMVVEVLASSGRGPSTGPDHATRQAADTDLPVGAYLGSLPANQLVSRKAEYAALCTAIEAVVDGMGRAALLAGEPGVGKTRLAQEVTSYLRDRRFTIVAGRCYEPQTRVPFYPFLEALQSAYQLSPRALQGQVSSRWPDLLRLLPGLAQPSWQPESSDHQRLLWAVTGFLQTLAEQAPLAILLDDLHWADASSVELLQHLARHTRLHRIFLLGTYRDAEVGRGHPLATALRDLEREDLLIRIEVVRLTDDATADLVASIVGHDIPPEFAQMVHETTEGNPFFVQQIVRDLLERGDDFRVGGQWSRPGELDVPESIRSVVAQRVERLGETARSVLAGASVLGQTFEFEDLLAMMDHGEQELESALGEATDSAILAERSDDVFAFDHALTQQALYSQLTPRARRRYHRAAGSALERLPEWRRSQRAAELTRHFLLAGEDAAALPYALLAGDQAELVFAHSEAEIHYRSALDLAGRLADRRREADAMEKLGFPLYALGRTHESVVTLDEASRLYAELGDLEREMQVTAQLAWALLEEGGYHHGIERLTAILPRWEASPAPSPGAASIHVALATLLYAAAQIKAALPIAERASQLARAVGDLRLLSDAESRRGLLLVNSGNQEEGLRAYDEAISLAETSGNLANLVRTLNNRHLVHLDRGSRERAWADLEQALSAADKMGSPTLAAWTLGNMGRRAFEQGDWPAARAHLTRAAELLRGRQATRSIAVAELAGYRLLIEGTEGAYRALLDLADESERKNHVTQFLRTQLWLARWELLEANPQSARARMESALAHPAFEGQYRSLFRWTLARALIDLGEVEDAAIMAKDQLDAARWVRDRADWLLITGIIRGRQSRWSEAVVAFDDALGGAERSGNRFVVALILHEYGLVHVSRGAGDAARGYLERALAFFSTMGAQPYIRAVGAALSDLD